MISKIYTEYLNLCFSLSLTSGDFNNLESAFELPNDNLRVNYKALVEEIDTVFTFKVKIDLLIK